MAPSLDSFEAFDALLTEARVQIDRMRIDEPDDGAMQSVQGQLSALHDWTRGGRCPSQNEKDQLNFGLIASRELDVFPLAPMLYRLASFVTWWGEPAR